MVACCDPDRERRIRSNEMAAWVVSRLTCWLQGAGCGRSSSSGLRSAARAFVHPTIGNVGGTESLWETLSGEFSATYEVAVKTSEAETRVPAAHAEGAKERWILIDKGLLKTKDHKLIESDRQYAGWWVAKKYWSILKFYEEREV